MAKYDFKGLKRFGARGLSSALSSTGWGAWLTKAPVIRSFVKFALEWFANWLANNGLMVLNLGAIAVEGEWDQKAFDAAMEDALKEAELNGLTPAQIKAIDDKVIAAFRKFAVFRTP